MNWTGGRLRRHSKQNMNSVVARQKQHFARARANLLESNHPREPFVPAFLRKESYSQDRPRLEDKFRQKRLEEFESVAPIVDRLSSLTPKLAVGKLNLKRNREGHEKHRPTQYRKDSGQTCNQASSITETIRSFVYNGNKSTKSANKSSSQEIPSAVTKPHQDTFESKKRKLLDQNDWVRLDVSRPLHVKYNTIEEKEMIGKRRIVASKPQMQDISQEPRFKSGKEEFYMSGALVYNKPIEIQDIKIKIGEDAFLSQTSACKSELQSELVCHQSMGSEMDTREQGKNTKHYHEEQPAEFMDEAHELPVHPSAEIDSIYRRELPFESAQCTTHDLEYPETKRLPYENGPVAEESLALPPNVPLAHAPISSSNIVELEDNTSHQAVHGSVAPDCYLQDDIFSDDLSVDELSLLNDLFDSSGGLKHQDTSDLFKKSTTLPAQNLNQRRTYPQRPAIDQAAPSTLLIATNHTSLPKTTPRSTTTPRPPPITKISTTATDEEIWRRFVFGALPSSSPNPLTTPSSQAPSAMHNHNRQHTSPLPISNHTLSPSTTKAQHGSSTPTPPRPQLKSKPSLSTRAQASSSSSPSAPGSLSQNTSCTDGDSDMLSSPARSVSSEESRDPLALTPRVRVGVWRRR